MIPRTTLPTREMENKAMNISLLILDSEPPSCERAHVGDAETLNHGIIQNLE